MKVLSIGNSFSYNAHTYLRDIAKRAGDPWKCINLYIGGCSLQRHHTNLLSEARAYEIQFAGEYTGFKTSIHEALFSDEWDVVTLQQVSHLSEDLNSYIPYIDVLAAEVRRCVPHAKLWIHQTWAYEDGSERLMKYAPNKTNAQMFANIRGNYESIFQRIQADGMIPAGEAMYLAHKAGLSLYADGFHANATGRYLVGMTWYQALSGKKLEAEMLAGNGVVEDDGVAQLLTFSQQAIETV